ncbi:DNA replication licensing factor MCM5 [Sesamum angolense]|uniref:DNA helicase n=1 Tax=Sesamum angolense TaxID=2727404 RepID=A0AAE1WDI9_9LAMI|nr:DNA replication licensing factor MCM5 [Sesamum angolense]
MSGWDEGGVYYSDQAQFPHGGGGDQADTANRHTALQKFKEFIRNFQHKSQPNVFPYREALLSNPKFLLVDLADLISYDPDQTLPQFLRQNPADYLPLQQKFWQVLDQGSWGDWRNGRASAWGSASVIEAQYISKLVKISGIVIAASRTKAKATYVTLLCKNCKNVKLVPCRPGLGGAVVPRSCDHNPQPGEDPCPIDPWVVVPDKSKYVDQQTLKLQENPEDVPTGELPRNMLLSIDRILCKQFQKGAVAVRQPYIRVVGLEETSEANSRGPTNFTRDETLPDGVRLRGDINVLLLGDPSTAKSQFLKFVEKTAPIAVYTSGKGSSAAGLTASVIRDNSSREFYLEGGAMVLADGGVVCIDEFDKMRAEDRVAIHEAMEQQTISIAKAGITTVLNSRTSTAQDNIDLQTTILSRFDLIFIVKDIRMYAQDKNIASHVIKVHASADAASGDAKPSKEDNWLKRYVHYCRTQCHPRLSESAASRLQESYVKIRQDMRRQANETGEAAVIPITVRQLEAIVRLSEALARMTLSHVANDNHVMEAIRLFNNSTMDAARSGINQHINLTPELANEIKQAETQNKEKNGDRKPYLRDG